MTLTTILRLRPLLTAFLTVLLLSAPAHAGLITVEMFVDGTSVGRETISSNSTAPVPFDFSSSAPGYEISGSGFADFDPFLSLSLTVANFSENALVFTVWAQSTYIAGPYDTLLTEFSSTAQDLDNSGGASVNPFGAAMLVPNVDGTDVLAAALGAGCNPLGPAGFNVTCDPASNKSVAYGTLASGNFGFALSFVLSNGDKTAMLARTELTKDVVVAPEPASIVLLGLGAVAVARRRKARSA